MAEAAVAPHVDDDVAAECLAEFDGQLAAEGHRFGIVAVDVQDRRLDRLATSDGKGEERANFGLVVKPIWLLMMKWIVPPVR